MTWIEHGNCNLGSFTTSICSSQRWCAPLFLLGIARGRRATTKCDYCGLGGSIHRNMHHFAIIRGVHVTRVGSWCAICGSLWTDLSRPSLFDTQDIPKARMESRALQQTISGYRRIVEWVGSGSAILPVYISCRWPDAQLRTGHHGHRDHICALVVVVLSSRTMVTKSEDSANTRSRGCRFCRQAKHQVMLIWKYIAFSFKL